MATWVTTFLIPQDREPVYNLSHYRKQFERLLETGVPIVLFLDKKIEWKFNHPNLKVYPVSLEDTWIHSAVPDDAVVTTIRVEKDTLGYMKIQHTKVEWLHRAKLMNPFKTEWFGWIDMGIQRVLTDAGFERLRTLVLPTIPRLVTPGCWAWVDNNVWKGIHWRFCGGLLLIHGSFTESFFETHKATVLRELPKFTWEVNIWALMEWDGYSFGWTHAPEHNDSMVPSNYDDFEWGNFRGYDESIRQLNYRIQGHKR